MKILIPSLLLGLLSCSSTTSLVENALAEVNELSPTPWEQIKSVKELKTNKEYVLNVREIDRCNMKLGTKPISGYCTRYSINLANSKTLVFSLVGLPLKEGIG